jgi:hypothetical protein
MKVVAVLTLLMAVAVFAQGTKSHTGAGSSAGTLLEVKRIYVGELSGGVRADALRDLIIASLNSTRLFVLTDNEQRADAVLKGAGDDTTFTDTFDTYEGNSGHDSLGKTGSSLSTKVGSLVGGNAMSENESHHSRERKHEAFATVRLCNKDGDVLWSTTQESLGAKFKGASADVASKIAHQMLMDYDQARRAEGTAAVRPNTVPKQ